MNHDIYLYGMVTYTTALLLRGAYPQADGYSEIREKHCFPGGETGTASVILTALGCKVKMDGNHMGVYTDDVTRQFYENIGVDVSRLHCDPAYPGIDEVIVIDKDTRTTFGPYASYFEDYYQRKIIRWNTPREEDIKGVKAAGIDPFFGEESVLAARYCQQHNVPFVTIDERFDHPVCEAASVIVVSSNWIRDHMPEFDSEEGKLRLHRTYTEHTGALVVFTGGGGTTIYGRKGEIKTTEAYKADVVSTLGAGDTFKAGCVYGLAQGWGDGEIIRFSMACAAAACTKFPLPHHPPSLEEVERLMGTR
ncbi:MAG: carbohydrate kinase family protein [Oscillospiraceae bacterium]|nr:carbohydrate kinase family protein [Oscillospiraceae bacterium]